MMTLGKQTAQSFSHTQISDELSAFVRVSDNGLTVALANPAITTQVSETARVVGQPFTDMATVTGSATPGVPAPSGTVSFRLYTSVAACVASPQSPEAESLNRPLTNGVATSGTFNPQIGNTTYTVVATYNGDLNYNTVSGACAAENEQVVVEQGAAVDHDDGVGDRTGRRSAVHGHGDGCRCGQWSDADGDGVLPAVHVGGGMPRESSVA